MGTLRKLLNWLGFSKNKDQNQKTAIQAQQSIAESATGDHNASRSYRHFGTTRGAFGKTPGAFGKKPTIARCKKLWRNRHGRTKYKVA